MENTLPSYPVLSAKKVAKKKKKNKYLVEIKRGVLVDVYSVLVAFNVTNPADAHAIKKMLMPGRRGIKDSIQDRKEAIASIERAIEIEIERNSAHELE